MSRQDATDLLMGEREGGVFLVRDSATIQVRGRMRSGWLSELVKLVVERLLEKLEL